VTSDSTDPRRVVSNPNRKSGLARARRTNHTQQLWYPWRQELRNAGARRSNGALLRRKHRSILYRNSATPATHCFCVRAHASAWLCTLPRMCAAERGPHHCSAHHRCTDSGHGVQLLQVPRQLHTLLQYERGSADLYVFGSRKNTEGYQFSAPGSRVIFEPNKSTPNPTRVLVEK
jgi:hypothetical protein